MRNNKDNYFVVDNKENLIFDAENCNDFNWSKIISILRQNIKGFQVYYGDGDVMTFTWDKEEK